MAINIVNYRVSRDSVRSGIINSSLPLTRDNIYSEIQRDLMRPIFVSSLMANDTFLKDWAIAGEADLDSIKRYLREIKERYGFFSSFFVSDISNNYYYYDGILKQISPDDEHDDWYYSFRDMDVKYDLDVDTDQASGNTLTIFINHRLNDYLGNLLGVTGVGLKMDEVAQILEKYRNKYNRKIFLVDEDGLIQVHVKKDYILSKNIRNMAGIGTIADKLLETGEKPSVQEFDGNNGDHVLVTSRYIPEFKWYLIVEQSQDAALAEIWSTFVRNMIFAALVIAVVITINIFMVNYYQGKLELLAVTDKLTGVYNRRELDSSFAKTVRIAKKQGTPLSVVLIDIDNFKKINDQYGHLFGDTVIKKIVHVIKDCMRDDDLLVRWGGDEFMALSRCELHTAVNVAERIRTAIIDIKFVHGEEQVRTTASFGVAHLKDYDDVDSLTKRADDALYAAKEKGRNCVVSEEGLG
ncbi:sensor domain-containing diguanylate cyclase [Limisalsivibrio acetivorans]|uniref:sensor domain-containing diguanylate cyclase n=1 Tax=Limisalsivibrio acetivorans TaxID=1304888 RepID=UPI00192E5E39|nr:sensor domain-containing diguanylate cyclase [Limisalsivibrio acetivorans]